MNNYEEDGVLISQDAIENSLHKKAKRKQTLAQLPVYATSCAKAHLFRGGMIAGSHSLTGN